MEQLAFDLKVESMLVNVVRITYNVFPTIFPPLAIKSNNKIDFLRHVAFKHATWLVWRPDEYSENPGMGEKLKFHYNDDNILMATNFARW